jgi:hypothetical protein
MTRNSSTHRTVAPLGNSSSGVAASRDHIPNQHRREDTMARRRTLTPMQVARQLADELAKQGFRAQVARKLINGAGHVSVFDEQATVVRAGLGYNAALEVAVCEVVATLPIKHGSVRVSPVGATGTVIITVAELAAPRQRPPLKLIGTDGNAFAVLGAARNAANGAGWTVQQWEQFKAEATRGDYDNLLGVVQEYFDVK